MNLTSHFNRFQLIILLFLYFLKFVSLQNQKCVNPQNTQGVCVPLQFCSYLVNVVRAYPNDSQWFLRQSICGFDRRSNQQLLCCPQYQQPAQERNYVQPSTTQRNVPVVEQVIEKNLLPKCGFDVDNRIFGGKRSSIGDFAWLALLRYSKPGSSTLAFKCSGSLINNRYVLTAAHCVHPRLLQNTRLISVRFGEWNLLTGEDCETQNGRKVCAPNALDVPIEDVQIHENYQPLSRNQHNDIALIRLARKVPFNDFIKPICLQPDKNMKATDLIGQTLTVTGFGATENAPTSNFKLHVSLNVVDNEQCNQAFRGEGRRLNETLQICAGGVKNQDSCKGDSGGPLMKLVNKNQEIFWVLYGIVSYGAYPCGQDIPGIYTKVDHFTEWIENKIKP